MWEFVALFAGIGLGALFALLDRSRASVVAPAAVVGVLVAWMSGELGESWAFALFDAGQAIVAALLAHVLVLRASAARRTADGGG